LPVLNEGCVQAGQDIIKVGSGPENVTVAAIDALLYLPRHSRDALERALRIPALSPGWKSSLQSLVRQGDRESGNTGLTNAACTRRRRGPGFAR
jgi:MOSC domain-containing protein YiiM